MIEAMTMFEAFVLFSEEYSIKQISELFGVSKDEIRAVMDKPEYHPIQREDIPNQLLPHGLFTPKSYRQKFDSEEERKQDRQERLEMASDMYQEGFTLSEAAHEYHLKSKALSDYLKSIGIDRRKPSDYHRAQQADRR